MQRGISDNYGHQSFHNPATQKLFGRSNRQSWKAFPRHSYSANVPPASYSPEGTDHLAYPPNELSSSCHDSTLHYSKLISNVTGGSQSETMVPSPYSRPLTTGIQPTSFQNRSMQSTSTSFQSCKFVPSQNSAPCWNQGGHQMVRNFTPYQNPVSTDMEPSAQSLLDTRLRPPLQKHKVSPPSEQPPVWSDRRTPFVAGQVEHYWNKQAPDYQQMPVHGSFIHKVNQQFSNEYPYHLGPFQKASIEIYKESIGPTIFQTGHHGEGTQVLQKDAFTVPQVATQNHSEAPMSIQGSKAIGNKSYAHIPSPDGLRSASGLAIDAQWENSGAFQNHGRDYEPTYRGQNISDTYSQNIPQYSRKRKSVDVMKFLSELSSRELKALMVAFELSEKKKQTAGQVGQLPYAQQNPTKMQSCQFTPQNASCKGVNITSQRSVNLVNGYEEISKSYPSTVLKKLQKEQISHVNHMSLNTNPTAYSNFIDLSMRDYCTQSKNMNSNVVYPNQGSQKVLPPHLGNSQYFCPDPSVPCDQAHKENSVCQNDAETSHSKNHSECLGTDCNLNSYSFNYSTKNLETPSSINPNYPGSSQQNGSHHSIQPMNARTLADINQIDIPDLKTNASQHNDQSFKKLEALYNMLQSSHINKTNSHSKRQKVEAPLPTIRPSAFELDYVNTGSFSAIQSTHVNQVTEYIHNEPPPYTKCNASSPSAHSHSKPLERQNALQLPKTLEEKGSVPTNECGDKSNNSLIRFLLTNSMNEGNNATFMKLAEHKFPCCSSELTGNPQPQYKMDVALHPQSITEEQQTRGYPGDECTVASVDSPKSLALVSEEVSTGEETATNMVHFSTSASNDQKDDASVPEDLQEQDNVSPAQPLNGQAAPSICNTHNAELNCKASSGLSTGNHEEKITSTSDIYTTKICEVSSSSPERVIEELTSVSNSKESSAKESDTLEFILRSLGIIPEDSEEGRAEESTVLTSPDNLSCTKLQQNPDIGRSPESKKQKAEASLDPFSKVSSVGSNVASISIKENQCKLNVPADFLYNDDADSVLRKLKSDEVNQLSSLYQIDIQVKSNQNTTVLSSTEDNTEDCQIAKENLPDNLASAETKMQKHTVAINTEDGSLHDDSISSVSASQLSSPSSSSHQRLAQLALINTVPNQPVHLSGSYNDKCLRNCSDIASSRQMPVGSDCYVINASTVNMVRYKRHRVDGRFDLSKELIKQLSPAPQNEIMGTLETMGMSKSQDNHENILLDTAGISSDFTLTAFAGSTAETEISSDNNALNSADHTASDLLHAKQDVPPTRVRLQCTFPASGIHSFLHNSNDELNPLGVTVGQEKLDEGSLVQEGKINGCTAVAAHTNHKTDLPSGIRITFVYSLSEYWEHSTSLNDKDTILGPLATAGRDLQKCFRKVCSFSTHQVKQKAKVINGKGILSALMRTSRNLGASPLRGCITEMSSSQGTVHSMNNSPVDLIDTFSTSFHPELNLGRIPADDRHANAITASTNISKLVSGNVCCTESSTEGCPNVEEKETSALCCWSTRETMNQNIFSQNKFPSVAELELSTESILRFWSPSNDVTEVCDPSQEPEKGSDFERGIQRICSGLGIYTAASEVELSKSMHNLSALHHLQFDFTAAISGNQVHGETSHLNGSYNQCSVAEVTEVEEVAEELKSKLVERTAVSYSSTDEDNVGNWTDTALVKLPLETCSPKSCLQNGSDQMRGDLDITVHGDNETEAGKTEMSIPAGEWRNGTHEPMNKGSSFTGPSAHPFRDDSLNEQESDSVLSTEIRIKVLEDQELTSVLSELSSGNPSPESVAAKWSSEGLTPETHWKSKNCDPRYLDIVGKEQLEMSATVCSSETLTSRTLSFSRTVSSLQQ
ncbi:uncharacterized protein LOC134351708 [Mobula hypostoma]|uniref:uncharacterized protein LOC134351708 n=1 Tax=Mobula hypostoma TaxID=723540 RepID=UPI002FC290ED